MRKVTIKDFLPLPYNSSTTLDTPLLKSICNIRN